MVEVCSICINMFIILQREQREASKLIDVARSYKGNTARLILNTWNIKYIVI